MSAVGDARKRQQAAQASKTAAGIDDRPEVDPTPADDANGPQIANLRERIAEALFAREYGTPDPAAHPDHNRWTWQGDGHSEEFRDHWRQMADVVLDIVAPVSRPNAAPVDSGAIGRLSDAERAEIFRRPRELSVSRDTEILEQIVERIVREHTDRALAEVADRIEALPTTRTKAWATGWDSVSLNDALSIVRAARQERGR